MSQGYSRTPYRGAVADFRRARRRAVLEQVASRILGRSAELLSYEQIRKQLRIGSGGPRTLRDIPLDAIVGSVDRYSDFTRSFLPKRTIQERRWAGVQVAATGQVGLPPIEVYQVGEAYFVLDGHHRVSVARRLGATLIQAYVTEVRSRVPLSTDTRPEDLVLKAESVAFLQRTGLDSLRPKADLSVTAAGQYAELEEQIAVHRHHMDLEQDREIPYPEAVAHWYDTVYLPVAQAIGQTGILQDFPGRTEADLYLWVQEHRAALAKELGWEARPASVALDLGERFGSTPQQVIHRVGKQVFDTVVPQGLEAGPAPGQWRQGRPEDHLFVDLLVALDGTEGGWRALQWATILARREAARLVGLYVVSTEAEKQDQTAQQVKEVFERRCAEAGVPGTLTIVVGQVSRQICERARLADLVVLSLSHPYSPQPAARLDSGLRQTLRRSPAPVVTVPKHVAGLDRVLLAYDGSPKAAEALFVATYLAGRWDVPLIVLTVMEDPGDALLSAQSYAEDHGVQVITVGERGLVAETILVVAEEQNVDLVVMGGYGAGPVVEFALGSTVERVLRSSSWPVLVCQ